MCVCVIGVDTYGTTCPSSSKWVLIGVDSLNPFKAQVINSGSTGPH